MTSPKIDLSDKVVVVTGAAGGMGRSMATAVIEAGGRAVAFDVSRDQLSALDALFADTGRLLTVAGDVTSEANCIACIDKAVEWGGRLDALVNNAGVGMQAIRADNLENPVRFWEVEQDRWDRLMAINVRGSFMMAKAAAPHLVKNGWGRIVNVTTSFDTMLRGAYTPYGQSKAALEAATCSWSFDMAGTGVTVNALLPGGAVDTSFFADNAPLDRSTLIRPEQIVAPLLYLLSEDANEVTSQRFVARLWDPALPAAEAAAVAGAPAGWPSLGGQSMWPKGFSPAEKNKALKG